jgi:hypothetical protein
MKQNAARLNLKYSLHKLCLMIFYKMTRKLGKEMKVSPGKPGNSGNSSDFLMLSDLVLVYSLFLSKVGNARVAFLR